MDFSLAIARVEWASRAINAYEQGRRKSKRPMSMRAGIFFPGHRRVDRWRPGLNQDSCVGLHGRGCRVSKIQEAL